MHELGRFLRLEVALREGQGAVDGDVPDVRALEAPPRPFQGRNVKI